MYERTIQVRVHLLVALFTALCARAVKTNVINWVTAGGFLVVRCLGRV